MNVLRFRLSLTPAQCLSYYRGGKSKVVAESFGGKTIQFPANIIHRFITSSGIQGEFQITYDENNKLIGLSKIGD